MARKSQTTAEWAGSSGPGGTVLNPDAPDINTGGDIVGNFNVPKGSATEDELRERVSTMELPSELTGNSEQSEAGRYASSVLNGKEDPIEAGGLPKAIAENEAKKPKKTLEEKRADFSRLASARVSRAIDALNALNHLSSIQSYDWTEEAKDKIFATLREKIDTVEASFVEAKAPTEGRKKTSKQLSFRV